jgi:hypothetical protein
MTQKSQKAFTLIATKTCLEVGVSTGISAKFKPVTSQSFRIWRRNPPIHRPFTQYRYRYKCKEYVILKQEDVCTINN